MPQASLTGNTIQLEGAVAQAPITPARSPVQERRLGTVVGKTGIYKTRESRKVQLSEYLAVCRALTRLQF